jgi:hypothetical protein
MIISDIPCLSANARHQLQNRLIRCFCLQNKYQPHYHRTDSVLTIISQDIWIKIGILHSILIIFETFRAAKSCMRLHIPGRQIDYFRRLRSRSVTGWGGWRAVWRWSQLWSPHSTSGGGRCTSCFASPACLQILCSPIVARKAAGRLVMTKNCRVSLYRSLHLFMPRKLNTPLLRISYLGAWFLNAIFRFLNCSAQKAFSGHCGHIQRQAHVGLFQLYPTSLPCHSCRYVENLQDDG